LPAITHEIKVWSPLPRSVVRKTNIDPSPEKLGFKPTDKTSALRPGDHALGNHGRGGPSPFVSVSELRQGARDIYGEKYWIYIDRAVEGGAEYISHEELATDLKKMAGEAPETYARRVDMWLANQMNEKEALFRGDVPANAIDTVGMRRLRVGSHGLQVAGMLITAYDLGNATNESLETGSVKPITAETLRQVGSWGTAWAGFKAGCGIGALVGIETGPGASLFCFGGGLIGGWAGYKGGDTIGDMIDEN
jgi:hypothetical protein